MPCAMNKRRKTSNLTAVREAVYMALGAVVTHKLRSFLTLLGVVVGVFSIIVVMTAMRVLQNDIEKELGGLGVNTFVIEKWPGISFEGPSGWEKYRRRLPLTMQTAKQLRERATLAQSIGASVGAANGVVFSRFYETNPDVTVHGVTPEVFPAKNWVIGEGRAIMPADVEGARDVCVIGDTVAKILFPFSSPLGEMVKCFGVNYRVVGILEPKGGMAGAAQDNFIAIPLTVALNRFGNPWWTLSIFVQAPSHLMFDETVEQVRGALRAIRKTPPGEDDDFEVISNDSLIEQFRAITFAVRIGVTVISSIALVAAGIGIMNIMLVSVRERTREIGIRRAIGARKSSILTQFLVEAVVICQLGGIIGIILGIAGGNIAAYFFKTAPVIPVDWVILGMLICVAVGVVFGTYPAIKAANLDPIEALRYE